MIKYIIKMLFYEIPKDILNNGAWDKTDHIETYQINLYLHHEIIKQYNPISHVFAIIFLNIISLFMWEVALSRIIYLLGVLKVLLKPEETT